MRDYVRWAAMVLMTLDHWAIIGGPSVLRLPGRLAYPLFAALLADGMRRTRSVDRYLLRLVLLAIVSDPLVWFCLGTDGANALLELSVGLVLVDTARYCPCGAMLLACWCCVWFPGVALWLVMPLLAWSIPVTVPVSRVHRVRSVGYLYYPVHLLVLGSIR